MKITKIENLETWMSEKITNITDIKPIHELAMSAVVFECYNNSTICKEEKYNSIDEFLNDNCIFRDTTLEAVYNDLLIAINDTMYFFNKCYITKNQHLILVVKSYIDDIEDDDYTRVWEAEPIFFLVEGI